MLVYARILAPTSRHDPSAPANAFASSLRQREPPPSDAAHPDHADRTIRSRSAALSAGPSVLRASVIKRRQGGAIATEFIAASLFTTCRGEFYAAIQRVITVARHCDRESSRL